MNKKIALILFLIFVPIAAHATTYNWYFSQSGNDTTGAGTEVSPWKSIAKINSQVASMSSGTDTATIYLKRGDTWTLAAGTSDIITIGKSNVTIDAYGSGNKPILDGNNAAPTGTVGSGYPGTVPYNYGIMIQSSSAIGSVYVKNLTIQNMYPGGGIIFKGGDGYSYSGPGSVEYCDINTVGWAAIHIYKVYNSGGSSSAIKIEHNTITGAGKFASDHSYSYGWPGALDTGLASGHEARYNTIWNNYDEGILCFGLTITEYNQVYNTKSGSIYLYPGSGTMGQNIIRYNLVWGYSGGYSNNGEIRVDDEQQIGNNTSADIQIYGNIVVGGYAGIDLRNNPLDGASYSNWGSVKVYNNTFIDNKYNIIAAYGNRFSAAEIKNNASIINSDASADCQHFNTWSTTSWATWSFGPNFYYGGATPSTPFYSSDTDASGDPKLGKTSGFRTLTSAPSFSDVYPTASDSALVDSVKAAELSVTEYLTAGTNWSAWTLTDQDDNGDNWDFGAAIYYQEAGGGVESGFQYGRVAGGKITGGTIK